MFIIYITLYVNHNKCNYYVNQNTVKVATVRLCEQVNVRVGMCLKQGYVGVGRCHTLQLWQEHVQSREMSEQECVQSRDMSEQENVLSRQTSEQGNVLSRKTSGSKMSGRKMSSRERSWNRYLELKLITPISITGSHFGIRAAILDF